jgi:hypothetical protein
MQTKDYSEVREWALRVASSHVADSTAFRAAKVLLELLPKPTMAEIDWEHDIHHLAGATTPDGDDVVMMWLDDVESGLVMCSNAAWHPDRLTPNGKRYELREVTVSSNENVDLDQPEHPTVLETEQDFEDAPEGTIVARGAAPMTNYGNEGWCGISPNQSSLMMSTYGPWTVLRWGWGE